MSNYLDSIKSTIAELKCYQEQQLSKKKAVKNSTVPVPASSLNLRHSKVTPNLNNQNTQSLPKQREQSISTSAGARFRSCSLISSVRKTISCEEKVQKYDQVPAATRSDFCFVNSESAPSSTPVFDQIGEVNRHRLFTERTDPNVEVKNSVKAIAAAATTPSINSQPHSETTDSRTDSFFPKIGQSSEFEIPVGSKSTDTSTADKLGEVFRKSTLTSKDISDPRMIEKTRYNSEPTVCTETSSTVHPVWQRSRCTSQQKNSDANGGSSATSNKSLFTQSAHSLESTASFSTEPVAANISSSGTGSKNKFSQSLIPQVSGSFSLSKSGAKFHPVLESAVQSTKSSQVTGPAISNNSNSATELNFNRSASSHEQGRSTSGGSAKHANETSCNEHNGNLKCASVGLVSAHCKETSSSLDINRFSDQSSSLGSGVRTDRSNEAAYKLARIQNQPSNFASLLSSTRTPDEVGKCTAGLSTTCNLFDSSNRNTTQTLTCNKTFPACKNNLQTSPLFPSGVRATSYPTTASQDNAKVPSMKNKSFSTAASILAQSRSSVADADRSRPNKLFSMDTNFKQSRVRFLYRKIAAKVEKDF